MSLYAWVKSSSSIGYLNCVVQSVLCLPFEIAMKFCPLFFFLKNASILSSSSFLVLAIK